VFDETKRRREFTRWMLLSTLDNARPIGAWEELMLSVVQAMFADATKNEVRREIDYLDERELVRLKKHPDGRWWAELSRHGVDVVEYTVECDPGIARPPRLG
jgi:hypothetical protein